MLRLIVVRKLVLDGAMETRLETATGDGPQMWRWSKTYFGELFGESDWFRSEFEAMADWARKG